MARNKLLGNIASLGIVQIANYAIPMMTVPIISRVIGPENYGVINYLISFVSYFTLLIAFGFDYSATRVIARDPENVELRNSIFSKVFLGQFFLFIISTFIFIITLLMIKNIQQNARVAIFTYLSTIGTLFTQNWLFQAMQDLKKIAIFNFLSRFIGNLFVILLVTKRELYYLQPLIVSFTSIIVSLLSFFWAIKKFNIRILIFPFRTIFAFLMKEKTIFFNKIAISLYTITNTFMLGFMVSKAELGYYSAAATLINIICTVVNMPLSLALYPYIGKEFGKGIKEGSSKVKTTIPMIFYTTLLCTLMICIFGDKIIYLFYGKEYVSASYLIKVMSLYPFVVAFADMFKNQILLNLGHDRIALKISIIGGIISPVLNFVSIKLYGALGAAINWISIEIILCLLAYYYVRDFNILTLSMKDFSIIRFFNDIQRTLNINKLIKKG